LFFSIGSLRNIIKIWSFLMGWLIWLFYVSFENLLIWSILELWRFFVLWLSVFFWLKKLKVSKLRLCWSHGLKIITWWSLCVGKCEWFVYIDYEWTKWSMYLKDDDILNVVRFWGELWILNFFINYPLLILTLPRTSQQVVLEVWLAWWGSDPGEMDHCIENYLGAEIFVFWPSYFF
jgi:hypothetical protein